MLYPGLSNLVASWQVVECQSESTKVSDPDTVQGAASFSVSVVARVRLPVRMITLAALKGCRTVSSWKTFLTRSDPATNLNGVVVTGEHPIHLVKMIGVADVSF